MLAIDQVYGGLANVLGITTEEEAKERRKKGQEKLKAFWGSEELWGPPTEEEWRHYRASRDAHAFPLPRKKGEDGWNNALRIFPEGPWHPEDQAFLLRAMELFRAGEADLGLLCAVAIGANPTREHLPLLDEILANSTEHLKLLRRQKRRAFRKLGIPWEQAGAQNEHGWADEEDEDE